ncbi:MAG: 2TM domain-containing protein [Alphaproteobacteria bacterium]|nr:2TM domain-containing protein [Alphaproteobacteria bacterium]
MNEHQVREHVRKLRRFYSDALIYGVVNLGLILIWAISGGGYFWPIWVIIGWGIGLGIHAFSLGLIPQMNAMVPFMTAEWEDQEVKRLMQSGSKNKDREEKKEASHMSEKAKEAPAAKKKVPTPQKKIDTKTPKEPKA